MIFPLLRCTVFVLVLEQLLPQLADLGGEGVGEVVGLLQADQLLLDLLREELGVLQQLQLRLLGAGLKGRTPTVRKCPPILRTLPDSCAG